MSCSIQNLFLGLCVFFLTIVDKLTFEGIKKEFSIGNINFISFKILNNANIAIITYFLFWWSLSYTKKCKLKSVYFFCKHSVIVQCKCLKKLIQFSEYSLIKFRETTLSKITFRRLILYYPNKHLCCIQQIFYIWKVCFTCSIKGNEESTVPRYITEQQFVNLVTITS